jgi:DNA-binding SARP family transcriptional activator/membrane-associated phospholipid phosphatase
MLRLQLLGGFRAEAESIDGSVLARQPRRAALLTLVAVEREIARERLIAMLWPESDADRGRHSLNQGIYYLRRIIGADWVELQGERCVAAEWLTTDVQALERAAAAGDHEHVVALYGGAFLAGASVAATAEFDVWADARRASIDRQHRAARRARIAALLGAGRLAEALQCAEEWCVLDPVEDEAQHRVIELLAATGQRSAALQQFAAYQRLLEEYELKPLDDTVALVAQLQQGGAGPLPDPGHRMAQTAGRADAVADALAAQLGTVAGDASLHRDAVLHSAGTRFQDGASVSNTGHRAAPAEQARGPAFLHSRTGLAALLAGVFAVNLVETTIETWLEKRSPLLTDLRLQASRAAHWFEGNLSFDYHDLTNPVAIVGYTTSYFFIFPALLIGVGLVLARRPSIRPFRVFATAIAINYLVALPFFLLFPVPERWFYSATGAVVLSDLLSTRLIDMVRPISGLDNSFPSFHVSLSVITALLAFVFRLRYRWSILYLAATVVLATFVLGIHWLPDLLAGAAGGVLSVSLAILLDRRLGDRAAALAPAPSRRPILQPAGHAHAEVEP